MKTFILMFFMFISKAYSLCAPADIAKQLGCEAASQAQACVMDYGYGMGVNEEGMCTARNVSQGIKNTVPSNILGQVKSGSDEVDAVLTMMDHKRKNSEIFSFKVLEVKTFHESHIESLLKKMASLRENVYLLSVSVDQVDSKLGKQAIIYAARYYSFVTRIHQIMASAAHNPNNAQNKLDYDQLKKFSLKIDKRIGLEILARMNLKARHLDSETLKFVVSEEEKQNYEFNVLNTPSSLGGYAKLVQFMSIREFLNNRWALTRMSNQVVDDPTLSYCGPKMLSFKPGYNGKMSTSGVATELDNFDLYFTRFPKIIDSLVSASKKASLLTAEKSSSIMDKVFKGIPSFSERMISEYGWTADEIVGWKNDISATLKQNEDKEWEQFAKTTLSVVVFPGDRFTPANLEERILQDIYNLRKQAVATQVAYMMNDLLPAEKVKLEKIVNSAVEEKRSAWESAMRPLIKSVVSGIDDLSSFKNQNYLAKLSQTKEISTSALSAAYLQSLVAGTEKKYSGPKRNIKDLEPKGPAELVEFFQAKMVKDQGLNYFLDKDAEKSKLVASFFEKLNQRFSKLGTSVTAAQLSGKLFQIAQEEALALRARYPLPAAVVAKKPLSQMLIKDTSDNTRTIKPNMKNVFLKLTVDKNPAPANSNSKLQQLINKQNGVAQAPVKPAAKPVAKASQKSAATLRSGYNVLSMTRFQPKVADNTRVSANRALKTFEAIQTSKSKSYVVSVDQYNHLTETKNFVTRFLDLLNLSHPKSTSFLKDMADQGIMADIRLAAAYNGAALLKIPLQRTQTKVNLHSRAAVEYEAVDDKPAMIRMLEAYKLNKDGTQSVNEVKLVGIIKETIGIAFKNQKDKTKVVCLADHTNPSGDNNFKTLYRSSTFIRQGILSNESLLPADASRLEKLDTQLKQETRYWHEAVNEDYVEPMMNVATVLFIVSAIIIPILGSGGILAPGSVMLAMTMLDGVDLAITGASLYFRSVSTFYEMPAQVKFQRSLANTQVQGFALTSWDDVKAAESGSKLAKTMLLAFSPLDALVGGQFYFSAKKLVGVSGKQALMRAGMQVRGFGAPTQAMLPRLSMKEMIKAKGPMKGIAAKAAQEVTALKYWTPRYQALTPTDIADSLRKSLVMKSKKMTIEAMGSGTKAIADEPWSLIADLKASANRIDDRLNVTKVIDDLSGEELDQVALNGRLTWKEFVNKPSYSQEYLVPKTFIKAVKEGNLVSYIENWGDLMTRMNRLRGQFLNKRQNTINVLIEKLEETKKLASTNPSYLSANGKSNWMDHFQSLLSDAEIKTISDISKVSQGTMKEFKSVFKDHEVILESIVSFSSVQGKNFTKVGTSYAHGVTNSDEKNDIAEMYMDMLNDHSSEMGADDLLEMRQAIEEDLF